MLGQILELMFVCFLVFATVLMIAAWIAEWSGKKFRLEYVGDTGYGFAMFLAMFCFGASAVLYAVMLGYLYFVERWRPLDGSLQNLVFTYVSILVIVVSGFAYCKSKLYGHHYSGPR